MGFIVPTDMHPERDDQPMPYEWFVGIDWGSQQHQVCVLDGERRRVGERAVDHDGASLARLATWLWTVSAGQPQRVAVAIEVPRGAIVEGLLERVVYLHRAGNSSSPQTRYNAPISPPCEGATR